MGYNGLGWSEMMVVGEGEGMKRQWSNLNGEHGDSLRHVYIVPHTEVVCVLSHHHITQGHPLCVCVCGGGGDAMWEESCY